MNKGTERLKPLFFVDIFFATAFFMFLLLEHKFYFMRGQKVFNDIIKNGGVEGMARRGRNNSLVTKRNDCLLARYYYYGYFKNHCYEDIVRQLVAEFFLSPNTIVQIVQTNTDKVLAIRQKSPTLYFFQNRWPHLKWM